MDCRAATTSLSGIFGNIGIFQLALRRKSWARMATAGSEYVSRMRRDEIAAPVAAQCGGQTASADGFAEWDQESVVFKIRRFGSVTDSPARIEAHCCTMLRFAESVTPLLGCYLNRLILS